MSNQFLTGPEMIFTSKQDSLRDRLRIIQSLQNPTADELSSLLDLFSDPNGNALLQAAAIPVFQCAGVDAVSLLFAAYRTILDPASDVKIRISYALSQISETPAFVFEEMLSCKTARIRQNAVIGLAGKNDRTFDVLLYGLILQDPDPQTAYEAAEALEKGGADVLPYFESVMGQELKQNPYIASEMKINASDEQAIFAFRPDPHVLAKVIEIAGDIGNEGTLRFLTPYLPHPDARISRLAVESIHKIKTKIMTENG